MAFPEGTKVKATAPDGSVVEWEITGTEQGGTFTHGIEGWETTSLRLFLRRDIPVGGKP